MYCAKVGGRWCPTKKALRAALAADPASVRFEGANTQSPDYRGNEVPEGVRLTVVGPSPRRRIWSATVMCRSDGALRVS